MATLEKKVRSGKRIHWMDNLRTIIIFLVLLYHVGGVYEAAGMWGWFWIVDDPATISWVGILGLAFDVMVMPTIFFISGYLTPASLERKTGGEFLKSKLKRLMIPWAVAVVTLIPLYKVIFLYSRGLPQEHWTTYFHITNPNSQNWLWFLPLLFTFNVLYLLLSKLKIRMPKLSLGAAVAGSVILSVVFSLVTGGLLGFRSWTLTPIIDFENERLLAHILIYLLGSMCYRKNTFAEKPKKKLLYIIANSVAWIPVTVHIFARLYPFLFPDSYAVTPLYRLIWFASFHLSTLVMVYVMVESFWRYLNKTGKLWIELNKNSYGVYIIHVIVIGIFGTILLNMNLPALVKYLLLTVSSIAGSNLIVSVYRSLVQSIKSSSNIPVRQAVDAD